MLMLMLMLNLFISCKLPPKWGEAHRQVAARLTNGNVLLRVKGSFSQWVTVYIGAKVYLVRGLELG